MKYRAIDNSIGEIKLYGEVSSWWNSSIDFTDTLAEMERNFSTIRLRIHSIGGSVFEGTAIFNALQACKSRIEIYIDGIAASMASIIMLAGDVVYMADNAFIMIHAPSTITEGSVSEHETATNLLKSMEINFSKAYALKTGKSKEDALKWLDGKEYWFNATQAKNEGLIDGIIKPIAAISAKAATGESTNIKSVYNRFAALLSNNKTPNNKMEVNLKEALIKTLSLSADATDEDILKAVEELTSNDGKTKDAAKGMIAQAYSAQLIDDEKKALYDKLVDTEPNFVFNSLSKANIGMSKVRAPKIMDLLTMENIQQPNSKMDKSSWGLNEYRKHAPQELQNNPDLYQSLLKKEGFTPS